MKVEITDGKKIITLKDVVRVAEDELWVVVHGKDWLHKFKKESITAICETDIGK